MSDHPEQKREMPSVEDYEKFISIVTSVRGGKSFCEILPTLMEIKDESLLAQVESLFQAGALEVELIALVSFLSRFPTVLGQILARALDSNVEGIKMKNNFISFVQQLMIDEERKRMNLYTLQQEQSRRVVGPRQIEYGPTAVQLFTHPLVAEEKSNFADSDRAIFRPLNKGMKKNE